MRSYFPHACKYGMWWHLLREIGCSTFWGAAAVFSVPGCRSVTILRFVIVLPGTVPLIEFHIAKDADRGNPV